MTLADVAAPRSDRGGGRGNHRDQTARHASGRADAADGGRAVRPRDRRRDRGVLRASRERRRVAQSDRHRAGDAAILMAMQPLADERLA